MRRLLVVNALIFAVLAAAAALAYYGYSATSEQTSYERERVLMQDLVEEKVANLEYLITASDTKLMQRIELAKLTDSEFIKQLRDDTGAAFSSIYVLDDQLQPIPGGHHSTRRDPADGIAYRDWFLSRVLPSLQLPQIKKSDVREHLSLTDAATPTSLGRPYLFSYMKRISEIGRAHV